MLANTFPVGTEVILWARIADNVILLFGEGVYEGTTYLNGGMAPVVRLSNGKEAVMHYQGVVAGRKEAVAQTCRTFQGAVMEWDLDAFLKGQRPSPEQIARHLPAGAQAAPAKLPEPKTVTDRLLFLKREIELEENKKKVFLQGIDAADKVISAKRAEMKELKDAVLKELADIDGVPAFAQVVARETKAAQEHLDKQDEIRATGLYQAKPATEIVGLVQPEPARDHFDAEANRIALED